MQDRDEDPFAQLGAEMKRRRHEARLSQDRLAVRVGADQAQISKAETGRKFPSAALVEAIDDALDAGGSLVDLYARAWRARQAKSAPYRREEDDTDRREVLRFGGLTLAASAAAEISRRLATAEPHELTLDQLEAEVHEIAGAYEATPHAAMAPRVVRNWQAVEDALTARTTLATRGRLTLLAGQLCFYLGRLAFNTSDDRTARTFAVLAGQYAADVGEPLLAGSVAGLRSSIAYYAGQFTRAADLAARARPGAHPYARARLAAYEARAQAAAGRADAAHAALAVATDGPFFTAPMFGASPYTPDDVATFSAVVAGRLGEGVAAERHARVALGMLGGPAGAPEHYGDTLAVLAVGMVGRPAPEPVEAAAVAMRALDVVVAYPTRTVLQRTGEAVAMLQPYRGLPEVDDVSDRLSAVRAATFAGGVA